MGIQVRLGADKDLTIWDWIIGFGAVATAVAVAEVTGLSPKWENSFVYTVIVFVGVIVVLHPAWGRGAFWGGFVLIFFLHVGIICLATQALPAGSRGIHGIPLIAASIVEGILICGILSKIPRRESSRSTNSTAQQ